MADHDDARQCQGGKVSVAVNSSGRAALEEMAQARVLLAQDGHLMSQGDEFELQGEATANPEGEQMGYWGSPVRRAGRMGGCASG